VDKFANIEIRVLGQNGNIELTPSNYDIKDIISILESLESMLFPATKKDRPTISYSIEKGSVRHKFRTSMQAVLGFSAILGQIQHENSIDFLELKSAEAIERIQQVAYQKNYAFEISTSVQNSGAIKIDAKSKLIRSESIWVDAEFYFYGTLTNAGGKSKVNVHLDTQEFGSLTIDTPKEFLENKEDNLLYKKFGVRASGRQNSETGEIDRNSLKLIHLIHFSPKYDEEYLNERISKAKKKWQGVNKNEWLKDLRGGYDA